MNIKQLFFGLFIATFFTSCTKDEVTPEVPLPAYNSGVLILNQGGFGNGNANVSYLSNDFNTLQNNIFSTVNPGVIMGDTGQDIGFNGQYAYIILNVSNKIQIVNRFTFKLVTTISTNLNNPRYVAFSNGKMFVTNWGTSNNATDDYVATFNTTDNTFLGKIPVVEGPERILVNAGKVYVAHKGGFGYGNKITIIDAALSSITTTITVGDVPDSMRIIGNDMYVLSSGNPNYAPTETAGKLSKINLTTNTVSSSISFAVASHPSNLDIYNNDIYYTLDEKIFKTTAAATTLPSTPLFTTTPQGAYGIYSFEVENNKIFIGDAGNYSANGKVYVYSLTGTLETSKTVGVIPAGFYFN